MAHRDRHACAAAGRGEGEEWDGWEPRDGWREDPRERPRRGVVRRAASLLKLAIFLGPLAAVVYGFVADCPARPSPAGWLGFVGAGACARSEILGGAASMPEGLAVLRRLID